MTRRDDKRIPPDQRSPYGRGKVERKATLEERFFRLENCDCPICRANGLTGDNMTRDFRIDFKTVLQKQMSEALGVPSSYLYGMDFAEEEPSRDPKDALKQAEQAAREPVKQFLVESASQVSWSDIVGNEEALAAMREAVEYPTKHKALSQYYGKKASKGVLLKGPPGCGKTMIGRAAARVIAELSGHKQASMLSVKATELQQPYVGFTEKLIRNLFTYAKAYKALYGHQLTIFIDEADAILPDREGARQFEVSNVSTFLTEMDGLDESSAFVLLATNRPERIDAALLRDGRIDRRITVQRPTVEGAGIIFERAMAAVPVHGLERDDIVARAMDSFFDPTRHLLKVRSDRGVDYLTMRHVVNGAMMLGLAERAKALAMQRDIASGRMTGITMHDIAQAIEAIVAEQREQPDMYALREFAKSLDAQVLEVDRVKPEIKFNALN